MTDATLLDVDASWGSETFELAGFAGGNHGFKIMECSIKRFPLGQYSQTVVEAARRHGCDAIFIASASKTFIFSIETGQLLHTLNDAGNLALAGRAPLPFPLGRLRAARVVEIGEDRLAFDRDEAEEDEQHDHQRESQHHAEDRRQDEGDEDLHRALRSSEP